MTKLEEARFRSAYIAKRIQGRIDADLRQRILARPAPSFDPPARYGIGERAWEHVRRLNDDPRLVFAHPEILRNEPATSEYYRGIALLPRKRVNDLAANVDSWEKGKRTTVSEGKAFAVACFYNSFITSIIEGSTDWTIENGYRNLIANMAIGLDGSMRNIVGQMAEEAVQNRIVDWLRNSGLIVDHDEASNTYRLTEGYSMRFGSEPDIEFSRHGDGEPEVVATIEIKGGKDPAGALERLGAIQKSFAHTKPGCVNMLIAGVATPQMRERLTAAGITKVFMLDDLTNDGPKWLAFLNEVFHHTVRITERTIRA